MSIRTGRITGNIVTCDNNVKERLIKYKVFWKSLKNSKQVFYQSKFL